MSDNVSPGHVPGPEGASPEADVPRRGAHRAPAKPQRTLALAAIALAAVIALLVAFTSCGDGFESGQGVVEAPPTVGATATTTPATPSPTAASPTATPTPTATSSPTPTTSPRPTASPTSTPTASPTPPSGPRLPVAVLNGTRVTGLAASAAAEVREAGWQVSTTGNWRRTTVTADTVFFGPGDEGSARRLARELSGDQRVAPILAGMSSTTLTYVVTG